VRYPSTGFILINSYSCPANSTNPRHLSDVYGVWVYSRGTIILGGDSPAVAWGLRSIPRSFHVSSPSAMNDRLHSQRIQRG
jgi:hypothetical protein